MARAVIVTLVDDFDKKSAADETVSFAIDGVSYEMDLSAANSAQLREALEQWIRHARKVGRTPRRKSRKAKPMRDRNQATAIREWARENGHKIARRGRISSKLVEAYAVATT
ncbi:histone-like nucleoid-structuring protein Lsr2 [Nocardia colli]|uniref:histone-like nucleoid-structuring protein Lsr2 n=1 Tax=Nocardia colli TaxID=2545717 RepID=UPI0035DAE7D4